MCDDFTGECLFQSGVVKPSPKWYRPDVLKVMNLALEVKHGTVYIASLSCV
jgi:hypothetical protein